MSGEPFPKASQLARGERRYRRKIASAKQWAAIIEAKRGPCRVCDLENVSWRGRIEYHHLLARSLGGDDVAENIVPLHSTCHRAIEGRLPAALRRLSDSLTDAEYAYLVSKRGEGAVESMFGVSRGA